MSNSSDEMTSRTLSAALTLFARHGYQRTSMADVAAEAGISRATLYARFRDKAALFEGLAATLVDRALADAEAAWAPAASLADNLEATILAKDLPLFRLLHASPHGAALLAVDAALTRAHAERLAAGYLRLLTRRAAGLAAMGADLRAFDGPDGFATFVAVAGAGLKHEAASEPAYREAVRRLCRVTAHAAAGGASAPPALPACA
jgi:AcrR family transcriptional regulator